MDKAKSQAFMTKVVGDVGTAMSAALVLVGERTGLFRAMADGAPVDAEALAHRTGVRARYVEEWLAAMACAGYVEHRAADDTFVLPEEHALYLVDPSAETFLGGLFAGLASLGQATPALIDAFRSGEGIPFSAYGTGLPLALEQMNRPVYEKRLVPTWLPTMPDVVATLQSGGRAIDVGCGTGVVPITLAKAFPTARIEGIDLDAHSIRTAQAYAREAGVAERVSLREAGADALAGSSGYDFVTTFDVIHDLPDPLAVLRAIRGALAEGGTYLMVEPKVDDRLEANIGNPFARMLYAISCLHCVPQALAQGGPGLGACWGPGKARLMAAKAGFGRFEPLPIRSPALAFYALRA